MRDIYLEADLVEERADIRSALLSREAQIVTEVARQDEEYDFCADCPMLKSLSEEERMTAQPIYRRASTAENAFITLTMKMSAANGTSSPEMNLGTCLSVGSDLLAASYTIRLIKSEAARSVEECEGPSKRASFLGPLALKSCQALNRAGR